MLRKRRRDMRKSRSNGELMLLTDTEECEPTRERGIIEGKRDEERGE